MTCETEQVFEYIQNDTGPPISGTYLDENEDPIDITGWDIDLLINLTTPIAVPATIIDGPAGEFEIIFSVSDLSEVGTFTTGLRFDDNQPTPIIVTYQGYFKIKIEPKIL